MGAAARKKTVPNPLERAKPRTYQRALTHGFPPTPLFLVQNGQTVGAQAKRSSISHKSRARTTRPYIIAENLWPRGATRVRGHGPRPRTAYDKIRTPAQVRFRGYIRRLHSPETLNQGGLGAISGP